MEQHQFWILLARKLSGEASLRDLYELEKALFEYPELQFSARLLNDLWNKREEIKKEPGGEDRFLELLEEAHRREYRYYLIKARRKVK